MKLTSLILSAAAFCSMLCGVFAAENYSLWPRRPAELEQARHLVREQKVMEAVALLEPYVTEQGIAGREARQIMGAVNVRRYLSRRHPQAKVYKVQRGDTIERIASSHNCPTDVLMLLNGLVEPSMVKRGQRLVVVPMNLRIEVHPAQREISVWDGARLVADYDIVDMKGLTSQTNQETRVVAREGYVHGAVIPRRSLMYAASDRVLRLEGDVCIAGAQRVPGSVVKMQPKDVNELALLVGVGARVSIVWDEAAYTKSAPSADAVVEKGTDAT